MDKKEPNVKIRKITKKESALITDFLDKLEMDKTNFIKNSETLKIKEADIEGAFIINGYDPVDNIVIKTKDSSLPRELLHVASCNGAKEQGICVRPNRIYKKTFGHALNEGVTDLFLEKLTGEAPSFPVEKLCAEFIEHIYGINSLKYYFLSDDINFRHQFTNDITTLMYDLDDCYSMYLLALKAYSNKKELTISLKQAFKTE